MGFLSGSASWTIRKCKGEKLEKMLILVALGANLPSDHRSGVRNPAETLRRALVDLSLHGLTLRAQSRFFATPCLPLGAGPDYVNAAAAFEAERGQTPQDILAILHRVEAAHGRSRTTRWAGRVLDLDLLAFENIVLPSEQIHAHWCNLPLTDQARLAPGQLILPHPRLADRSFVLVPLADVAPDWRHPVSGLSVVQMLAALPAPDVAAIRPLPDPSA
jgi:2-amino-4-hydroxy-6-hydroxymethyldihydropteridine diphosphokinase